MVSDCVVLSQTLMHESVKIVLNRTEENGCYKTNLTYLFTSDHQYDGS